MKRRTFGHTWWGQEWIAALEQRARFDPNRLPRGRTYARTGRVGTLRVTKGDVHAAVRGSRMEPYSVDIRVRVLTDHEWDLVLDAIAARAAHTAALLDGELPPEVVADARSAGVELLPIAGEVVPRCSCPDWANPCKHAAAVVYLMADVLDEDPFALLTLRGRTREEVLGALRQRRSASSGARPVQPVDEGVVARVAYERSPGPTPSVPLPPDQPGVVVPLAVDPPKESGLRRASLTALAEDAARRAWEICVGEGDGGLGLDERMDVIRRVATDASDTSLLITAWRIGGAPAVAVCEESWTPPPAIVASAVSAVGEVVDGPVRMRANRITLGPIQVRLGKDGRWYGFEQRRGKRWAIVSGPVADPTELL